MSLIIIVLSTSVSSFALGIMVVTLVLYCCMRARHRKPPISLTSKQLQQATHSDSQASEYQDVPVYQEVTEFKVPAYPLKSTKMDTDVALMQNSAYGHIHEVSILEDKVNENNDCVVVNPIYI